MAKIAVKRGIQNTNNKLMAEELKVRPTLSLVLHFLLLLDIDVKHFSLAFSSKS